MESAAKPGAVAATQVWPSPTPAIVPCASTLTTLVARLANVVDPALAPERAGANVAPMSTMRIFSAKEPKPTEGATVIVADAVGPSLVTVMLAVPRLTEVTTPLALTVATEVLSEDHADTFPLTTFAFASLNVTVAWVVEPTAVGDARDTVVEAMAMALTVSAAEPFFPSLAAVMLTDPPPIPVTTPALLTVATKELSDDQDTVRSVRGSPRPSLGVAVA